MEWIKFFIEELGAYIHLPYLLTFVLLSYFVKKYFSELLQRITKFEFKTVYIVLFFATFVGLFFWLFVADLDVYRILFSYALGTSLHELFFKNIENLIVKDNEKD